MTIRSALAKGPVYAARMAGRKVRRTAQRTRAQGLRPLALRLGFRAAQLPLLGKVLARQYRGAWLVMDRPRGANDNGEHFYRYLLRTHPKQRAFFVLDGDAPDRERLAAEGFRFLSANPLVIGAAYAQASTLIGSDWANPGFDTLMHAAGGPRSPRRTPFVFLQHGITKDDVSSWFNKLPISMICTALPAEQEYLTAPDSPYEFDPADAPVLTGFARFDRLRTLSPSSTATRRTLTVMPTWRQNLSDDFFATWRAALIELSQIPDLQLSLVLHPNLAQWGQEFSAPSLGFAVYDIRTIDFQQLLEDSDGFLTDYSSTAFDAALAGSAVAYFQFDREDFFSGEYVMRPGWFDYDRDGLGPVLTDPHAIAVWAAKLGSEAPNARAESLRKTVPTDSCEKIYAEIRRRFGA